MKAFANFFFYQLVTRIAGKRPPNFVVGDDSPEGPYLLRWYLSPWSGWFKHVPKEQLKKWQQWVRKAIRKTLPNLYLHKFMRDDDDRALHDHPSWAFRLILWNGYIEHTIAEGGIHHRITVQPGYFGFLRTKHTHRIELHRDHAGNPIPCWTLFLFGPERREWGLHCPDRGWAHWEEFTAAGKPGEVGKGCGP